MPIVIPIDSWIRAVLALIPFIGQWFKKVEQPDPHETAYVTQDKVFFEIKNEGATADFTVQITEAVNATQWPGKTVGVRWDHDKNAKTMTIHKRTKAKVRIAQRAVDPQNPTVLIWVCFWGSDFGMGQQSAILVGAIPVELHMQTIVNTGSDGPTRGILFLNPDGSVSYIPHKIES